jgi:uncharacterized membrane protein
MKPSLRNLLLILLLALALRLIALGSRTLWYDEAFAVLFSEKGLDAMLYGTLTPVNGSAADVHPLLYYTTLDGWMRVFGQSPTAVRLYSVLIGLLTIGVLYRLGSELFDERTGQIAAIITALAPFNVQYSQEARMYALLGLLLVAATWCLVRGWRTGQMRFWIGFGLLAGLGMYTQQLAAFYLVVLGLLPFLARRRQAMIRLTVGAGLALVIYLPWLVYLPSQFGKIGAYWVPRPGILQPLITLWSFLFADLPARAVPVVVLSLTTLSVLLVFLIYRVLKTFRHPNPDRAPLALTLALTAGPIGLMWLVSQWRPVYLTRALLPAGLMFYLALAWLLTRARLPRPIRAALTVLWLATAAVGLVTQYTWHTFPRPPFDVADQFIAARWQPGDRVVHASKITMLPMTYYDRSLPQAYVRDTPGSSEDTLARPTQETLGLLADDCAAAAARGSSRVWFVIFQQQIEQQGGASPSLDWMETHYHRVSLESFNDLLVYLYDQPDEIARSARCEASS